ncbi:hypothetical protein EBV26_12570, partial [bacterium]|nr:hypothetical protein [bacterium]
MGFELKLPDDVIKSVSDLADLVGAPTYIKTPVFPVRDPSDFRSGSCIGIAAASTATATSVPVATMMRRGGPSVSRTIAAPRSTALPFVTMGVFWRDKINAVGPEWSQACR